MTTEYTHSKFRRLPFFPRFRESNHYQDQHKNIIKESVLRIEHLGSYYEVVVKDHHIVGDTEDEFYAHEESTKRFFDKCYQTLLLYIINPEDDHLSHLQISEKERLQKILNL